MNFLKIVLEEKLKGKIAEIEKETGEMFAGLEVSFKEDHAETWMNKDLLTIEKPQLVKKAEEYLKKVVQGYTGNNTLIEWTLKGDSNV